MAPFYSLLGPVYCQSNNWWRFRKILWPSQNIWTLQSNKQLVLLCLIACRKSTPRLVFWILNQLFESTQRFKFFFICMMFSKTISHLKNGSNDGSMGRIKINRTQMFLCCKWFPQKQFPFLENVYTEYLNKGFLASLLGWFKNIFSWFKKPSYLVLPLYKSALVISLQFSAH